MNGRKNRGGYQMEDLVNFLLTNEQKDFIMSLDMTSGRK